MTKNEFLAQPEIAALSDIDALAAWQAVPKNETAYIKTPTMNGLLGQWKLKIPFKDISKTPNHEFRDYADAFVDSTQQPTDFNFDPETTMGAANISMLEEMINKPLFHADINLAATLSQFKDLLMYLGVKTTYPNKNATLFDVVSFRDAGETIALSNNTNHHTATISITTQPLKPTDIAVEQRFSKDGVDWTEWHSVGAFRNVDYPQRNYDTSVPKSPAVHRQLRAVSPLTLGVEIA